MMARKTNQSCDGFVMKHKPPGVPARAKQLGKMAQPMQSADERHSGEGAASALESLKRKELHRRRLAPPDDGTSQ